MIWGPKVYFIRRADGTGPIKIGCSSEPEARCRQLSWDMKLELVLLAWAPGSFPVERELHRRFVAHRVAPSVAWMRSHPLSGKSEWFAATDELLNLIDEVRLSGRLPFVAARNTEIVRRRADGETLQSIANDFGLTRERIRQITASALEAAA